MQEEGGGAEVQEEGGGAEVQEEGVRLRCRRRGWG